MKTTLSKQERLKLDRRVAETEQRTGAQIVLAFVERSDSYPELPWKAFSLGTALSGLLIVVAEQLHPAWPSNTTALHAVLLALALGASAALLCVGAPSFARIFLDPHKAQLEARQYAESMFLSREIFKTSGRTGVLILVALFERQVVVLPDTGIRKRLSPESLQGIVDRISQTLSSKGVADALEEGLSKLEETLASSAPAESRPNELSDEIVKEKGP
jgi:putative membrane protein